MRRQDPNDASIDPGPLGPDPEQTVATLADLGLSDDEIARYFRVSAEAVHRLRARPARVSPAGFDRRLRVFMA